jgi:hypothetical protein
MTYQQALQILYSAYPNPLSVSGTDRLRAMTSAGVPLSMASDINRYSYTAARTGTSIDSALTSAGLLAGTSTAISTTSPGTTTTSVPVVSNPLATTQQPTTTTIPTITVPSFTSPVTTTAPEPIAVPTITSPFVSAPITTTTSLAPISVPTTPTAPAPAPVMSTTVYRTDREVIQDGVRYDVMSDGSLRRSTDQANIPGTTTTVTSTVDERDKIRQQLGLPPLVSNPIVAPTTTTTGTTPVVTVPTLPAVPVAAPVDVPVISNPIVPQQPTAPVPVIQVPNIPALTQPTTVTPQMGGSLEDQINYQSAIRRLTAARQRAEIQAKQQRGEVGVQYESQIRKAGREMWNQQQKALASLGARGISGAPGLSVAAQRAGMAAPAIQYQGLINERQRQLNALERTLTTQLADYEEELRRNQEQLTRATTLANQLTGTGQ